MKSIKTGIYFSLITLLFAGYSQAFATRYYFQQQFSNNITLSGFFDGEDTLDAAGNPLPDGHIDQREVSFIEYVGSGHPILNQRGWNPNQYAQVQHILDYDLTGNSFTYDSFGGDGNKNPRNDKGQYYSPVYSSIIDFNASTYLYFHFTSSSLFAGKLWQVGDCYLNGNLVSCPPDEIPREFPETIVDVNALGPATVSTTPMVPIPPALLLFSSGLLSLVCLRKQRR